MPHAVPPVLGALDFLQLHRAGSTNALFDEELERLVQRVRERQGSRARALQPGLAKTRSFNRLATCSSGDALRRRCIIMASNVVR